MNNKHGKSKFLQRQACAGLLVELRVSLTHAGNNKISICPELLGASHAHDSTNRLLEVHNFRDWRRLAGEADSEERVAGMV